MLLTSPRLPSDLSFTVGGPLAAITCVVSPSGGITCRVGGPPAGITYVGGPSGAIVWEWGMISSRTCGGRTGVCSSSLVGATLVIAGNLVPGLMVNGWSSLGSSSERFIAGNSFLLALTLGLLLTGSVHSCPLCCSELSCGALLVTLAEDGLAAILGMRGVVVS